MSEVEKARETRRVIKIVSSIVIVVLVGGQWGANMGFLVAAVCLLVSSHVTGIEQELRRSSDVLSRVEDRNK
jgi:hypothetical protein